MLIPSRKQDLKAACDALSTNLQAGDIVSWIEVDEKTSVAQHLSEKDFAASVNKCEDTV
jgi:hypothetical protein